MEVINLRKRKIENAKPSETVMELRKRKKKEKYSSKKQSCPLDMTLWGNIREKIKLKGRERMKNLRERHKEDRYFDFEKHRKMECERTAKLRKKNGKEKEKYY